MDLTYFLYLLILGDLLILTFVYVLFSELVHKLVTNILLSVVVYVSIGVSFSTSHRSRSAKEIAGRLAIDIELVQVISC
jgi:hypothetical protein